MTKFERESRYLTIKWTDILQALTLEDRKQLVSLANKVHEHRVESGKVPLNCAVIESDWPEYESVWAAIKARVTDTPKPTYFVMHPDDTFTVADPQPL